MAPRISMPPTVTNAGVRNVAYTARPMLHRPVNPYPVSMMTGQTSMESTSMPPQQGIMPQPSTATGATAGPPVKSVCKFLSSLRFRVCNYFFYSSCETNVDGAHAPTRSLADGRIKRLYKGEKER